MRVLAFVQRGTGLPLSSRRTLARVQLWAMSVALEDHGEMVPSRGRTSAKPPLWARLAAFGP